MDAKVKQYTSSQSPDRQIIMTNIHSIIIEEDKTATPIVELMMGKEMIVYKCKGSMKYALSSVIKHMSLHILPIYGSEKLSAKYKELLPDTKFQKGCINFNTVDEVPLDIMKQLFADCSKINLIKIREEQLKERKLKAKAKK